MASTRPKKTPLAAILASYATAENRIDILRTCHAVLTTAMIQSSVEKGVATTKKGYKAECYAEALELIEEQLGHGAESAFIPRKQTVFTTPGAMPNGVVRTEQSRRTEQTTSHT